MENLKQYLKIQNVSIRQAAKQIGISRPLLHYALSGKPLGKKSALKVERWSDGFLQATDLMQLYND